MYSKTFSTKLLPCNISRQKHIPKWTTGQKAAHPQAGHFAHPPALFSLHHPLLSPPIHRLTASPPPQSTAGIHPCNTSQIIMTAHATQVNHHQSSNVAHHFTTTTFDPSLVLSLTSHPGQHPLADHNSSGQKIKTTPSSAVSRTSFGGKARIYTSTAEGMPAPTDQNGADGVVSAV